MASAAPTKAGEPPHHPSLSTPSAASPPNKRDLKSWWKGFKLTPRHQEPQLAPVHQGIFGVPLRQSITYANVAISLIDENGQSYIYGYVPIVVAKCGVFLKEKATGIEGIFRLSGSEKRIKELKTIFDSPDRYGKGLVWDGYTVHDAANVLRRYLNDLPEPVVPLDLYEQFRTPLRGATKQAMGDAEGPQFVDNFDEKGAIQQYQRLITELPPLNKQLLLYILDLLAVFAAKADENRMTSHNLAAIFQPGILSHPNHAMAPEEYRLNQCVLIFLIENQDHFLIGMQGTEADEKTKKEVESGAAAAAAAAGIPAPSTPTSNRKSGLGRSASTASAGAESVRRDGAIRRNRSVSSRNSNKPDGTSSPQSPAIVATPSSNLGRSNTVPSKKSPGLAASKVKKHGASGRASPAHLEPLTQVHPAEEASASEKSSLAPPVHGSASLAPALAPSAGRSQERLLDVPNETATPNKDRNIGSLFQRSPTEPSEKRQPNKLKKKRIPGSLNPSAQSSCTSLGQAPSNALPPSGLSPETEVRNPLEGVQPMPPLEPVQQSPSAPPVESTPAHITQRPSDMSSDATPKASQNPFSSNPSLHPDDGSKGRKSPPASVHSSFNEGSDMEQTGEDVGVSSLDSPGKERKRRWLLSRQKREENEARETQTSNIGSNEKAEASSTSIGSGAYKAQKSITGGSEPTTLVASDSGTDPLGRDGKDDPRGPLGWIKHKYREVKETAEQRRNKSPPSDNGAGGSTRGKSLDMRRETTREEQVEAQAAPPLPASAATTAAPPTTSTAEMATVEMVQQPPAAPSSQPPPVAATETPK